MKKLLFTLFTGALLGLVACKNDANTSTEQGKYTGVMEIDVWTEKIEKLPTDTTLYIGRYKAAITVENYDMAIEDAKTLVNLDSTKVEYYRMLGNAFFENNDSRNAIKIMEKAMERFPEDTYTKLALAEMHFVVEQYQSASVILENILKVQPYNTDALYMLGQLKKETGDTLEAMAFFQKTVEVDADHHDAYIQLGKLSDKRNLSMALKYLDNALRIDSTSLVAWMSKASYYHQRGNLDKAVELYEQAIAFNTNASEAYYNLGLVFLEQADASKDKIAQTNLIEKALKQFDTSTKYDVTFSAAYYYLGLSYEKLGDLVAAKRHYENALTFGDELQFAKEALERLK